MRGKPANRLKAAPLKRKGARDRSGNKCPRNDVSGNLGWKSTNDCQRGPQLWVGEFGEGTVLDRRWGRLL
jgi:hypothetical protein